MNYNPKSAPSPRQQIKLIQEKQKLLTITMQAAGSPIGSEAVTELMQQSMLSPRQLIKLIQEKQNLLVIAMQASGGSIGLKAVRELMQLNFSITQASLMQQSMLSPRQLIKLIQEKQNLLVIAMQASGGSIGLKAVRELMQLNFSITQASPTVAEILEEVKAAGVELTPGLVGSVKHSPCQNVRNAIAIFKTYPKGTVKNSAGLFYTILVNENLGTSKAAS